MIPLPKGTPTLLVVRIGIQSYRGKNLLPIPLSLSYHFLLTSPVGGCTFSLNEPLQFSKKGRLLTDNIHMCVSHMVPTTVKKKRR